MCNTIRERFEHSVKTMSLNELIDERQGMKIFKSYIPDYGEILKMVSKRISELRKNKT